MNARRTAAALVAAAVLVNAAFTGLGAVFDYPEVLKQPADDVLRAFHGSQVAVTGWFLALALGAALLAPVAVGVGRLSGSPAMRWAVRIGIAAAVVQVVGLLRWPLLVPGWAAAAAGDDPVAAAAARNSFGTANHVLGTLVGETGGYLLTAAWTTAAAMPMRTAHRIAGDADNRPTPTATGASSAAPRASARNQPVTAPCEPWKARSTSSAGCFSTSG
jgi:hypothetical protein